MGNLRDVKRRIVSVKNTRQITKAMKMVAGAKLKRATERAVGARPYQETLTRVLGRVAGAAKDEVSHPLLTTYDSVNSVLVVVMGSDRGLCGSFNGNLFRRVERHCEKERSSGRKVTLRTFGKKARAHFGKRSYTLASSVIDLSFPRYAELSAELAEQCAADFRNGEVQEVWLAWNYFKSAGTQVATITRILPLSVDTTQESGPNIDYKYEPDGQELLNTLIPLQFRTILLQALLDTEAGEQAARMAAMDNATRNASELVDALTLEYNRGRQAAITKELIEIVSGAEAL